MDSNSDWRQASQPTTPSPVLDREQIDGLIAAAGVSGAKEILDAFWRSTQRLLGLLQTQLAEGDFAEASKTAHALKGSALNVGAISLSCSARGIEDACRTNDAAGALKRLSGAQTQYADTVAAFDAVFTEAA